MFLKLGINPSIGFIQIFSKLDNSAVLRPVFQLKKTNIKPTLAQTKNIKAFKY